MNPFDLGSSKGEVMLDEQLTLAGLPEPEREYRFAAHVVGLGPGIRKRLREAGLKDWRLDFAWPPEMLAVEVQGGTWSQGKHTRGQGYEDDREKINAAQLLGWTVLEFTTGMIRDGRALRTIERALEMEDEPG